MNKNLQKLIELSDNDKAIDSYNPQLKLADKKVARANEKLEILQTEQDKLSSDISKNNESAKNFEQQLILLNEQLSQNAKKLKDISSQKEMKALSLEEDIAKEKMTFANEEIERLQSINKTKEILIEEVNQSLLDATEKFQTVNEETMVLKTDIEKNKGVLFAKREQIIRDMEQKILVFYEKIRIWAGNNTVVPVKKQACYGCFMKLNDKTYSEVIKADEICNCPHCGRIIYMHNEPLEA